MNILKGDKFTYIKFTIQYQSRCDENGLSRPKEGIKYYTFDDVETAKKVAVKEVEQLITPFLHCLTNEDYSDVKEFIKNTITV